MKVNKWWIILGIAMVVLLALLIVRPDQETNETQSPIEIQANMDAEEEPNELYVPMAQGTRDSAVAKAVPVSSVYSNTQMKSTPREVSGKGARPEKDLPNQPLSPELEKIAATIEQAEDRIEDLHLEYTCTRQPAGSEGRELTEAEQEEMGRYPGWYKPEIGVYQIKGGMIRIDRTRYETTSTDETIDETIVLDQYGTKVITEVPDSRTPHQAMVIPNRWHGLRNFFNPVLTSTSTGDFKLSEEIRGMDAELLPDQAVVNGVNCQVIKLTKRADSGAALRTFKVYLDPARDYSMVKSEKYWYDLQCLERVVEIKDYQEIDGVYIPTHAVNTNYNRPRNSKTSYPSNEQVLTVQQTNLNHGMANTNFAVDFAEGTKVQDGLLHMSYTIPDLNAEIDID